MNTFPSSLSRLRIRGRKSLIEIYPGAFNEFFTFPDFQNMLIDHEGSHAEEIYNQPETAESFLQIVLFYTVWPFYANKDLDERLKIPLIRKLCLKKFEEELKATRFMITKMNERECSEIYKKAVIEQIDNICEDYVILKNW